MRKRTLALKSNFLWRHKMYSQKTHLRNTHLPSTLFQSWTPFLLWFPINTRKKSSRDWERMHRFSLITTGDVFKTRDTYWPSKTIVISILSCNKFGNSQSWTLASTAYHYPFHEGTHWSFSFISTASMKHCLLASHSLLLHTHTHSIFSIQVLHILATLSFMALLTLFILILIAPSSSNAQWPPSPGYWPSSRFRSMSFYQGYRNLWGYSHQRVDPNALTIWLDSTSG